MAAPGHAASSDEARTEAYFQSIRKNPNLLLPFLREMPKGADLHNHLSGSIYAESLIQWGSDSKDCVDPKTFVVSPGPCGPSLPISHAFDDPGLYAGMIDAFSMRNWQLSGQSGHDHFFDTFGKFGQAIDGAGGKMLAETAARAASQHEVYQELMLTPTGKDLETLAKSVGWSDDFGQLQQKLLDEGLPEILGAASKQIRAAEASRDKILTNPLRLSHGGRRLQARSSRSQCGRTQPCDARGLVCSHPGFLPPHAYS
jgi:adenosine deaminase